MSYVRNIEENDEIDCDIFTVCTLLESTVNDAMNPSVARLN